MDPSFSSFSYHILVYILFNNDKLKNHAISITHRLLPIVLVVISTNHDDGTSIMDS